MEQHHQHQLAKHHHAHTHHASPAVTPGNTVYDEHAGHHIADFKKRFWICLVVTVPVLMLSHMIRTWLGFGIFFNGDRYVLAVLSTFVFLYGGWPFLKGLLSETRAGAIGMMTLIAIAITVAWAYSFGVTLGLKGMDFYWEMATLIVIMLLGHWIEMKSVTGASRSLEMLVKMIPSKAHLITASGMEEVAVEQLKKEDLVLVKPGEKVPVDGW